MDLGSGYGSGVLPDPYRIRVTQKGRTMELFAGRFDAESPSQDPLRVVTHQQLLVLPPNLGVQYSYLYYQ